jgi:hypothetical protein
MEGDEQVSEEDVAVPDNEWPYDTTWVDLGASPLEQLRRAPEPSRHTLALTAKPMIAP